MKLENLTFLRDVVVVRIIPKTQIGSFVLCQTAFVEKMQEGEVVAIGAGCKIKDDIKVGDKVYVSVYVGTPRTIDGVDYRVYDSEDIMAVL